MRFDHIAWFHNANGHYDPELGENVNADETVDIDCNVTDLGTNRSKELFGDVNRQALVLRLTEDIPSVWDYLTLDDADMHFKSTTSRNVSKGRTLIVGETDE